MVDIVDFDATLAEAETDVEESASTFPFKFLGQTWELPSSPLAKDMLKVRRTYMLVAELEIKQATNKISEGDANKLLELSGGSDLGELLAKMIGQPTTDKWFAAGMTDKQLKQVFRYLWRLYNGLDPNAPDQGEARPPANRGERRAAAKPAKKTTPRPSSKAGGSSKRISAGSTTSRQRKS